jgi:hypothetical protein
MALPPRRYGMKLPSMPHLLGAQAALAPHPFAPMERQTPGVPLEGHALLIEEGKSTSLDQHVSIAAQQTRSARGS